MVKWTSGGSERTFNQSAANGRNEPILPIFCIAAKVRFRALENLPHKTMLPISAVHRFAIILRRNAGHMHHFRCQGKTLAAATGMHTFCLVGVVKRVGSVQVIAQ
jgi:hypothetical protein